jgi:molybdopterin synthase sulfur carrier subunit
MTGVIVAKLVFLGRLADLAGGAERDVAPGVWRRFWPDWTPELVQALTGPRVRLALNGALVQAEGLELGAAMNWPLPPVSGG